MHDWLKVQQAWGLGICSSCPLHAHKLGAADSWLARDHNKSILLLSSPATPGLL